MNKLNGVNELTLYVTTKCNNICDYCWENHKNNKMIDVSLLTDIINDFLVSKSGGTKTLYIYGGEPTCNIEALDTISNIIQDRKDVSVYLLTNMLVDDISEFIDIFKRLNDNTNFNIQVSLDFSKEIHEIHRSETFDKVIKNCALIKTSIPTIKLSRMSVITNESLDKVNSLVAYDLTEDDLFDECLTTMLSPSSGNSISLYDYELLDKFFSIYFKNVKSNTLKLIYDTLTTRITADKNVNTSCYGGLKRVTVSVGGEVYPCLKLLNTNVNNIHYSDMNSVNELDKYHLSFCNKISSLQSQLTDKPCKECIISKNCISCSGINKQFTDDKFTVPSWYCENSVNIYHSWIKNYNDYLRKTKQSLINVIFEKSELLNDSYKHLIEIIEREANDD